MVTIRGTGSFLLEKAMWDITGANGNLWGGGLQDVTVGIKGVTSHRFVKSSEGKGEESPEREEFASNGF